MISDGKKEEDSKENEDLIMENLQLNLSQIGNRKRPRVHWAKSPLATAKVISLDFTLENSMLFHGIKENTPPNGDTDTEEPPLKKAFTGLLRSKSKNSSPMSVEGKNERQYLRPYMSPLNTRYTTTNEPPSSDTTTEQHSPLRVRSPPNNLMDIEDFMLSIGSSFFSDTDIQKATQQPEELCSLDEAFGELEDLELISSFDENNISDNGKLHSRFQVVQIEHVDHYLQLTCLNLDTKQNQVFYVIGEWMRSLLALEPPFIAHAVFSDDSYCIDDERGYLIIHPDTLISATQVADSITCSRRAVLSSRTQASVEDNKPNASLICGSIVHEIVEKALLSKRFDQDFISSLISEHVKKSLVDIYCAETDEASIIKQVQQILQPFSDWAERYFESPRTNELLIREVLKVEESIWSHAFGLKGKIDSTMLATDLMTGKVYLTPFELKTGFNTNSIAHRAQATLYLFMLWDRYKVQPDDCLLFYIAKSELIRLRPNRQDLTSLLMARNRLAINLINYDVLPPIISNKHLCSKCFLLETCTLYHKVVENGSEENSPYSEYFNQRTSHLGPNNILSSEFYQKWNRLVTLEENESVQNRQQLWKQTMQDRVTSGTCLKDLDILSCDPVENQKSFAGFECTFIMPRLGLLQQVNLGDGDPIVVSAGDQPLFGLAVGYLKDLKPDTVTVIIDRPLEDSSFQLSQAIGCNLPMIRRYRIDKDELTGSFGLLRTNLLKIMAPENERLMNLIVKSGIPKFSHENPEIPNDLFVRFTELDECQQKATRKLLQAQDYLLILGMPGTGKSTTVALAIQILIASGKTVLLSSHTHSAVDNILMKLLKSNDPPRFVRLGNPNRVNEALGKYSLDSMSFNSLAELEAVYMNSRLVACTCLGINHPLLLKRRFDVCIVDEASQISVPSCHGPLRLAQKFILVGDHYQLPPLVKSKQAMRECLNQSLFSILAESHPEAMIMLRHQYRMNCEIMSISNRLVYGGMLQCGNSSVETARLYINSDPVHCLCNDLNCWIGKSIDPDRPVIFLDTDQLNGFEIMSGNSYINETEAALIKILVNALTLSEVPAHDISIISPYRPQLQYLSQIVSLQGICLSTVDKFQGLDSDCIIISLVRSNPGHCIGQLLKDWNRLNVAFTRAKKKLILVGSIQTVLSQPLFRPLLDLLTERNWVLQLSFDSLNHTPN